MENNIYAAREVANKIKSAVDAKIDKPKISEGAEHILYVPFSIAKIGMFDINNKELKLTWKPSDLFEATAFKNKDAEKYEVRLTYGVAISIYRHAAQMKEMLSKAPMILDDLNLNGSSPIITKKPQIKLENIFINLWTYPLQWLFYHEIGHMIESHHQLSNAEKFLIDDGAFLGLCISDTSLHKLTSQEALVSQALEISADFQGFRFLIRQLAAVKDKKSETIDELDIWALLVGVACLFYHFYEVDNKKYHNKSRENASHPAPDLRFQFFFANVVNAITDAAYIKTIPWAKNENHVIHVLEHAWAFASSYWNNFYEQKNIMPEMFLKGGDVDLNAQEIAKIKEKWKELRSQITAGVFNGVSTSPMDFA